MNLLEQLTADVTITSVDRPKITQFIQKHYLKSWPASIQKIYLIQVKNQPVGMAIYGNPLPSATKFLEPEVHHNEVLELKRLYLDDIKEDKNLESFVVAKTMKMIKSDLPSIKVIISYADENAGHSGTIYQATNMLYLGQQNGKHKYAYVLRGNLDSIKKKMNTFPYPK